jgi:hypothetical protein
MREGRTARLSVTIVDAVGDELGPFRWGNGDFAFEVNNHKKPQNAMPNIPGKTLSVTLHSSQSLPCARCRKHTAGQCSIAHKQDSHPEPRSFYDTCATVRCTRGAVAQRPRPPLALWARVFNVDDQILERLEMSDEERERRKQVCDREYEFCYDWCSRSHRKSNEQRKCYVKCSEKNVECLDKLR